MKKKKSFKRHLSEIFLKQNFSELSDEEKKKQLKECFFDDLKWVLGALIIIVAYIIFTFY